MDKKNYYETLYIIDGTLSDDAIKALVDKFTEMIAQHGTVIEVDTDNWGKRRLAYPIQDKNEGYYVLTKFESDPDFPNELERVFGITEGIFRSVVTTGIKKAEADA